MHQGLHHVRASSHYSTCFRLAGSPLLHVSGPAKARISAAAPSRDVGGSEELSGAANQADLRAALTTVGGNGGHSLKHVAEVSDRRAKNSSETQPALHSSAAPFRPYQKRDRLVSDVTVYTTKEGSWQVHRKVFPEFSWRDMQQLCSSGRVLGLCALDDPKLILTYLVDISDGGSYALYSTDRNERLIEQLAADIQNKRPIEHYFLEQRTQDFIREQALKLGSAANVRFISGWVKDEDGKNLLKIDALAVVEDTLLLGVAESCASPIALQCAACDADLLRLCSREEGIYRMLNGLSHVKQRQVYLVSDELRDGIGLAEVLAEARKLKVGLVLRDGDHLSLAVDAPCMPSTFDYS